MGEGGIMAGALNKFYPRGEIAFDQMGVLWDYPLNAAGDIF